MPTQAVLDPKVHFNSSISKLNMRIQNSRRPQVVKKEVLYRESDVPAGFKEKYVLPELPEQKKSFIDRVRQNLEEQSVKIPKETDIQAPSLQTAGVYLDAQTLRERGEWSNVKQAGLVLGIEDFVKLDLIERQKQKELDEQ